MSSVLDSLAVEGLSTLSGLVTVPTSTAITLNGTLSLTAASTSAQVFTGTATGFVVNLPSATTLTAGMRYEFYNQSTQLIIIKDNSGATIITLGQTSIAYAYLQTNGAAAGGWIFWQTFVGVSSGIVNYNVTTTTSFNTTSPTDVAITGFSIVPTAGTYAVWVNAAASCTNAGTDSSVSVYNGATIIADTPKTTTSTSGLHNFQLTTQTVFQFDGVNSCSVKVKTTGNMTVTGRSLLLIRLGS